MTEISCNIRMQTLTYSKSNLLMNGEKNLLHLLSP